MTAEAAHLSQNHRADAAFHPSRSHVPRPPPRAEYDFRCPVLNTGFALGPFVNIRPSAPGASTREPDFQLPPEVYERSKILRSDSQSLLTRSKSRRYAEMPPRFNMILSHT